MQRKQSAHEKETKQPGMPMPYYADISLVRISLYQLYKWTIRLWI